MSSWQNFDTQKQGPMREVAFKVRAGEVWETLGKKLQQNGKVDLNKWLIMAKANRLAATTCVHPLR